MIKVQDVLAGAQDSLTVKRVFGDAVEKDGMTVIPAAYVLGGGAGAGAGNGASEDGERQGAGTGFAIFARPAGVYVVKDGNVAWRPAVDVNVIVLGGQLLALGIAASAGLLAAVAILGRRFKLRAHLATST
jgi:uncharacterized spore protein YtfJ